MKVHLRSLWEYIKKCDLGLLAIALVLSVIGLAAVYSATRTLNSNKYMYVQTLAVGLGIGACSHAVGTAKALEMGETEGAMSGLAIGICGIMTSILALFFEWFL